jgi:hypothetical protein
MADWMMPPNWSDRAMFFGPEQCEKENSDDERQVPIP